MSEYMVEMQHIEKIFRTRHVLQLDEETRRRRWYKVNEVHAAMDISFGIRPGEIFGLLGPNGAGKTTAVKMISGLVRPDKGMVLVDGLDVEKKRRQILRKVGVVLEGTRTSMWPLTPYENLMYYGNLKNVRGSVLKERAHDLLDFIGLKEKKNTEVRKLSRGQKQKLAICIALIADPSVLLLDEPTTGLDVQSSRAIKDKIIEMTRQHGRSVLVTTHDMHVAQELCDHIGIINKGRLVTCQPTSDLLDLFSDQVFSFKISALPESAEFEDIQGVLAATTEQSADGPVLVVRVAPDGALRSEALYGVTERLRGLGCRLVSVNQRQQNLESVFLQITGEPLQAAEEQDGSGTDAA
jgi:ABC-2 type transport system ATP-binding protein